MEILEHFKKQRFKYYLLLVCIVSLFLSTKGIMDEGTIALNGDMPKYLMNGVFFHDLIKDLPLSDLRGYAFRYFAQYPAVQVQND